MTSTAVIAHEFSCCCRRRVGFCFVFEFQVLVSFSHLANYSTIQLFIHSCNLFCVLPRLDTWPQKIYYTISPYMAGIQSHTHITSHHITDFDITSRCTESQLDSDSTRHSQTEKLSNVYARSKQLITCRRRRRHRQLGFCFRY